jgi:hypothetical protein
MAHPADDQPTPRPIQNEDDLRVEQIRALIGPFLDTLTSTQVERYCQIGDLLAQQDRIEADNRTDRLADIQERAIEGLIAHLTDPARLFRLLWAHCNNGPVDQLGDCCRSWVEP